MHRDTHAARGELPPLDRGTVKPDPDGTPGPFYYQRDAHPVGVEAERVLGELDGGEALLYPSGSAATTALVLALLAPGARVAVADGGYYGTVKLLRAELGRWGLKVDLRPDSHAAASGPRLARAMLEPDAELPGPRRGDCIRAS